MPGTREIKRRIKSIQSTKKITRAMQMISAVKMRKAQAAALATRTYADLAWQIVTNLADKVDPKFHTLLQTNPKAEDKTGIILISSNRGLIGGFNTNLINVVSKYIAESGGEVEIAADFIAVGKKGREAILRKRQTIFAEFTKVDRTIRIEEILPISKLLVNEYLKGTYNKIVIAYTHFYSSINQKPKIRQILPLKTTEQTSLLQGDTKENRYEYLFEPSPNQVLDYLLPRIIESQIYQAILENDASEHSSRMIMMKNATDAASDLITDLTLTYNQLRQANITKELSEITAGRIALE